MVLSLQNKIIQITSDDSGRIHVTCACLIYKNKITMFQLAMFHLLFNKQPLRMLPQSSQLVYFERKPKTTHIRTAQLTVSCKFNQIYLNISLILQYKGSPKKRKSMSILFHIYRDPSKGSQQASKSQITSTDFVGNLQHHNNIQSCSVNFFQNADQQVYIVIYFRESKNDKNFI